MRKLSLLAALSSLFVTANAFAYGDAGCGLGSMLIEKNTVLSQITASMLNGTGGQPFAMTSGTSNCKASGFVKVDREQNYYAEANYRNLQVEMAKGNGESLAAFAQLLGCSDASVAHFGKMTQDKYEVIFPAQEASPAQMLNAVKQEVKANPVLAQGCNRVG